MESMSQLAGSLSSSSSLSSFIEQRTPEAKRRISYGQHSDDYVSLFNDQKDEVDDYATPSLVLPTKSPTMQSVNNPQQHHSTKKAKKPRFRTFLRPRSWPNPFVQGR
jgi:hypothetical protein